MGCCLKQHLLQVPKGGERCGYTCLCKVAAAAAPGAVHLCLAFVPATSELTHPAPVGNLSTLLPAACCAAVAVVSRCCCRQELITLLPDLSSLLFSLSPTTLAQLTADTAGVAQKLVSL